MDRLAMISPILGGSGERSAETIKRMLEIAGYRIVVVGEDKSSSEVHSHTFQGLRRRFLMYEVSTALRLVRMRRELDIAFFHIGAPSLLGPAVVCRALGIWTVVLITGSESESAYQILRKEKGKVAALAGYLYYALREWLEFSVASRLIVYEPSLIGYFRIGRWTSKTRTAGPLPVDSKIFNRNVEYANRPELIGYVGRLSEEKGVSLFVKSLPFLFSSRPSAKAIVVGDGPLRNELHRFVESAAIQDRVEFTGWVGSTRVAALLNLMRLCVVPSTSEAVPTIMLQALACGTPVLASSVGGMQDTIRRGDLGYVFNLAEPVELAKKMVETLETNDLAEMSTRIALFSEKEFGMEMVARKYRMAITNSSPDSSGS